MRSSAMRPPNANVPSVSPLWGGTAVGIPLNRWADVATVDRVFRNPSVGHEEEHFERRFA